MKTVSEILGIKEPMEVTSEDEATDKDIKQASSYNVDGNTVQTEIIETQEEVEQEPVRINDDIVRIEESNNDIDVLIREGLKAVRETFSYSDGLEPRSKTRALEVASMLMKETTRAIKHKQDFGLDMIKTKVETSKLSNQQQPSSTQINNIYTDRETMLKMLKNRSSEQDPESDDIK